MKKQQLVKGSMGTSGLVLGITGLFVLAPVLSPLAIIFSSIGISRNEKYSIAGLVTGIIGLIMIPMQTAFWIAFMVGFIGAL